MLRTRENGMSEPTPAAAVPETVVAFEIVALMVAGPSDASCSNTDKNRHRTSSVVRIRDRSELGCQEQSGLILVWSELDMVS